MKTAPYMHHFGITISDLDRSVPFYTKYFELREVLRTPIEGTGISTAVGLPDVSMTLSFLAGRNTILELLQYSRPVSCPYGLTNADVGAAHPCFVVDDLQSLYERMTADGVTFNQRPQVLGWQTLMTYCLDPDGINVELLQPGPELELDTLLSRA